MGSGTGMVAETALSKRKGATKHFEDSMNSSLDCGPRRPGSSFKLRPWRRSPADNHPLNRALFIQLPEIATRGDFGA
jgi:hypothetical protein